MQAKRSPQDNLFTRSLATRWCGENADIPGFQADFPTEPRRRGSVSAGFVFNGTLPYGRGSESCEALLVS